MLFGIQDERCACMCVMRAISGNAQGVWQKLEGCGVRKGKEKPSHNLQISIFKHKIIERIVNQL